MAYSSRVACCRRSASSSARNAPNSSWALDESERRCSSVYVQSPLQIGDLDRPLRCRVCAGTRTQLYPIHRRSSPCVCSMRKASSRSLSSSVRSSSSSSITAVGRVASCSCVSELTNCCPSAHVEAPAPIPAGASTDFRATVQMSECHRLTKPALCETAVSRSMRYPIKSQPRTGHTREPDPTHNELKHTITRKTAAHERNQTHLTFTRTHTPLPPHSLPATEKAPTHSLTHNSLPLSLTHSLNTRQLTVEKVVEEHSAPAQWVFLSDAQIVASSALPVGIHRRRTRRIRARE